MDYLANTGGIHGDYRGKARSKAGEGAGGTRGIERGGGWGSTLPPRIESEPDDDGPRTVPVRSAVGHGSNARVNSVPLCRPWLLRARDGSRSGGSVDACVSLWQPPLPGFNVMGLPLQVHGHPALGARQPNLLGARRRRRLPVEGTVHNLAHALKPPAGGEGGRVAIAAPAGRDADVTETKFQLSICHNESFSICVQGKGMGWTNAVLSV